MEAVGMIVMIDRSPSGRSTSHATTRSASPHSFQLRARHMLHVFKHQIHVRSGRIALGLQNNIHVISPQLSTGLTESTPATIVCARRQIYALHHTMARQSLAAAYEDPDITYDTGAVDVAETKSMEQYLVPYSLALRQDWFLSGKPPPIADKATVCGKFSERSTFANIPRRSRRTMSPMKTACTRNHACATMQSAPQMPSSTQTSRPTGRLQAYSIIYRV